MIFPFRVGIPARNQPLPNARLSLILAHSFQFVHEFLLNTN